MELIALCIFDSKASIAQMIMNSAKILVLLPHNGSMWCGFILLSPCPFLSLFARTFNVHIRVRALINSAMEDKMGMCILCWRCNYSLQTGSHPIKELTIYTYMHTQTHILWVRLCFFSQFEIWNGTYGFVRVLSRMVTSQFLKEDSITILKQNEGRTREEGAQSNGMRQRAYVSFCVKIKPSNNKNHVQWIK